MSNEVIEPVVPTEPTNIVIANRHTDFPIYLCTVPAEIQELSKQIGYAVKEAFENKVNLDGVDLLGADLSGLDLTGISLKSSYLEGVDFRGSNLTKANLEGCILVNANLTSVIVTDATFEGSVVDCAKFNNVIFNNTNLKRVNLKLIEKENANFDLAIR